MPHTLKSAVTLTLEEGRTVNLFDYLLKHPEEKDALEALLTEYESGLKTSGAELAKVKSVADAAIAKLSGQLDKATADLTAANTDLAAANADLITARGTIASLTKERSDSIAMMEKFRKNLSDAGNKQRDALDAAISALGVAKAINTQALADDDARKIAEQNAAKRKQIVDALTAAGVSEEGIKAALAEAGL